MTANITDAQAVALTASEAGALEMILDLDGRERTQYIDTRDGKSYSPRTIASLFSRGLIYAQPVPGSFGTRKRLSLYNDGIDALRVSRGIVGHITDIPAGYDKGYPISGDVSVRVLAETTRSAETVAAEFILWGSTAQHMRAAGWGEPRIVTVVGHVNFTSRRRVLRNIAGPFTLPR